MNRVRLSAFAAALLLANSAANSAQTATPNDAAWSRAVDLIPLIDPVKDSVKGEWRMEGGKLISDMSRQAKVQIPFEPPDEYDFRIIFTCSEGMRTVCQYVSHQGRCAFWIMGGASTFLFPGVDGKRMEKEPRTAQGDRRLESNHQYTSVLQVRNDGVSIYVDGAFINRWVTDYSDARLFSTWEIPNHRCLAVGSDGTATTFQKIEVLEISGKGKNGSHTNMAAANRETVPPPPAPVAPPPGPAMPQVAPALPAEEQIQRVMAELKKLNPGFDGKETHTIRGDAVSQLAISAVGVKDISPLRALRELEEIRCSGTQEEPSSLSDLSPLRGLMLRHLTCDFTAVRDLSPLQGMPLAFLDISSTQVTDLTPLLGMPLTDLRCPPAAAQNKEAAKMLMETGTLQRVNGQSPGVFMSVVAKMAAASAAGTDKSVRARTEAVPASTPARPATTVPPVSSGPEKTMTTSTGMELVWIPPGQFMLGSTPEEREWAKANGCKAMWTDREGQQPRRTAIKDGYWLARTEMTVGHWRKFVEATGFVTDAERNSKATWRQPKAGFEPKDSNPITCISWNDAMAYCRWLTETETKAGKLPKGMVYRLPTEAEWEYACRAGKQTKFWWGDETSGCEKRLNLFGTADGFEYVSPVDSFGAAGRNGFGLADMLGNVWEWCLDEGDPLQAHAECHAGNSESRVLRGASCQHYVGFQRCAVRGLYQSTDSTNHYGFRVCCGVPGGSGQPVSYTTEPLATTGPTPTPVAPLSPKPALPSPAATAPAVGSTLITSTGMELVWIPPGEFMQGSTPEEREWAQANDCDPKWMKMEGEQPRRTAIKEGFWLGRTELAVGPWRKFVDATGYTTDAEKNGKATWRQPRTNFTIKDDQPVTCVSWNDAVAFCQWLTEIETKANKTPTGKTFRLPTEAEWEYACRAGTQTKFWWGDRVEDGKGRLNWALTSEGFEFVSPVDHFGARGRNLFGLADMLGNVWEWCLDGLETKQAHAECYKLNSRDGVSRGGAYNRKGSDRCAYRRAQAFSNADNANGFRVCCGVPDGSGEPSQNTAPLVAAVPPGDSPPPPPATAPTKSPSTILVAPPPGPAKPQVVTAQPSAPAMRAAGVKQTTFEISNLSTSSQYAYVNNAWLHNVPCIEVILRVNEDIGQNPPNIKAYFYNKDHELVKALTRPTSVSFGNRESFTSPEIFRPGKKYTVYFGISEGIQRGKNKWKYAIVLFGNRENATADIHPKEDIAPFDFPEKDLVLKGRGK